MPDRSRSSITVRGPQDQALLSSPQSSAQGFLPHKEHTSQEQKQWSTVLLQSPNPAATCQDAHLCCQLWQSANLVSSHPVERNLPFQVTRRQLPRSARELAKHQLSARDQGPISATRAVQLPSHTNRHTPTSLHSTAPHCTATKDRQAWDYMRTNFFSMIALPSSSSTGGIYFLELTRPHQARRKRK